MGRRKREWFDDDSFWRDLYPFLFSEARVESAVEDARKLLRLVRPRGRAVLDLCCGPGRFCIPLAKRGYRVTGVDRTRLFLAKARARARAARVSVEWVRRDMRDFVRPAAFDLALSMFTSFGYFDDKREDLRVLRNVRRSLRPGGAFLIETLGKEQLARIFLPVTSDILPDGTQLVQRHAIFDDWTRIRNGWTLIRRGRAKTYTFHHTIYSGQELRDRMEEAGFVAVRLYGGLDGRAYGREAERLVAVGMRERTADGPRGPAGD
ncbi:MAG TPA: class I SAM-dependent methyltransferase [Candidatus Eisenbacteria bacterium]